MGSPSQGKYHSMSSCRVDSEGASASVHWRFKVVKRTGIDIQVKVTVN
jgi:hypothetical protein